MSLSVNIIYNAKRSILARVRVTVVNVQGSMNLTVPSSVLRVTDTAVACHSILTKIISSIDLATSNIVLQARLPQTLHHHMHSLTMHLPKMQALATQSSVLASQFVPSYPLSQMHLYPFTSSWSIRCAYYYYNMQVCVWVYLCVCVCMWCSQCIFHWCKEMKNSHPCQFRRKCHGSQANKCS